MTRLDRTQRRRQRALVRCCHRSSTLGTSASRTPHTLPAPFGAGMPGLRACALGPGFRRRLGLDRERPHPCPRCVSTSPRCQQSDGSSPLGVATKATYVPPTRALSPVSAHSSKTTLIRKDPQRHTTTTRSFGETMPRGLRRAHVFASSRTQQTAGFPPAVTRPEPAPRPPSYTLVAHPTFPRSAHASDTPTVTCTHRLLLPARGAPHRPRCKHPSLRG